ncbi:hypothetical protein JY97_04455 [Alkalispirochaeta odontotermitis]|nr:hypothetical protein JY97_04455 [Alkalispirochaeta odontotermitis]CAB1081014.1 hypothetical protein D1AOALGA4SA_8679 [Olavius algarvensis Delta 1 endosymbiont]
MSIAQLEKILTDAKAILDDADEDDRKELLLLIKDLEEAKQTIFVKTADAQPFLERCQDQASALKAAVGHEGRWGEESKKAFSSFERAVSKLRNTILVRTQHAT